MVWKVCLHTWMTHKSVLWTGKHTSAIWRLFSQLKTPMASSSIWNNVFLQHLLSKFFDTRFRRQERPLWPITKSRNRKFPTPSGQTTATFSWHGKLVLLFFAQLCTNFETFNRPPDGGGGAITLEWTVSAQEAFQNAKPLLAAAVPLQHPAPNAELSLATDASDTHIGGVMQQESRDQSAATWVLFPQTHRHGFLLLNFWPQIISPSCSNQTFLPFLQRSSFSTLDRSQTTCYCHFLRFSPDFA